MGRRNPPAPLVLPAVFFAAGLIAGKFLTIPLPFLLAAFPLFLISALNRRIRLFALFACLIILGILRSGTFSRLPANHIHTILKTTPQILQPVSGIIVSEVLAVDGRYRFELKLEEIADKKVIGKVLFSTFQDSLHYGDRIFTIAQLQKIRPGSNPASFDYEEYLNARNIHARGYAKTPVKIIGNKGNLFQKIVIDVRSFIRKRIEQRFGEHAGFVKAITFGDRSDLEETRQILNRAGLSHLLAVSGLHVGIISLVLYIILSALIPVRNLARLILIMILVVYGAVCNWSPSVFRSVLMISLFLLSRLYQRRVNTNNILFACFIVITAIQPFQLFSAGFQMSFTAVFALLNILPKFRFLKLKKDEIEILTFFKKTANYFLILLISSFVLNLFLAPITIGHFKQFGMNGLLGNLLGIPLLGIILPLSLLLIFLPPVAWLISIYLSAFRLLMLIFQAWANLASSLPAHFDFIALDLWQIILVYVFLGAGALVRKSSKPIKISLSAVMLTIPVILILTFPGGRSHLMKIIFFDCGLGDLCLIEAPTGEKIMIDSGPDLKSAGHFSRSALPYLQRHGYRRLDWLIITHAHNDHYGGAESVFASLEVKNLVVTDEFMSSEIWQEWQQMIAAENCRVVTIIDTITLISQPFTLKILHPDAGFMHPNINNLSIVARLDFLDFSALFNGDLEHEGENYLLQRYEEFLPCAVLKAGHHGSRTASGADFIKKVYPGWAVISTALQNRFDFPHPETLKTFEYLDEKMIITGRDGALQISTDGKTARFVLQLRGKEYFVHNLN